MSGWFLLVSAIVQYQRKIKLLKNLKKLAKCLYQELAEALLTMKKSHPRSSD